MCRAKVGMYNTYWNQQFYERLGRARTKDN